MLEENDLRSLDRLRPLAREYDGAIGVNAEGNALPVGEPQPEQPQIDIGQVLGQVIGATAGILAPNWNIQPEESQALGEAYGALVDKYFPDTGMENWGAEITALTVTAMVFQSRAGVPMKKPEPKAINPVNENKPVNEKPQPKQAMANDIELPPSGTELGVN